MFRGMVQSVHRYAVLPWRFRSIHYTLYIDMEISWVVHMWFCRVPRGWLSTLCDIRNEIQTLFLWCFCDAYSLLVIFYIIVFSLWLSYLMPSVDFSSWLISFWNITGTGAMGLLSLCQRTMNDAVDVMILLVHCIIWYLIVTSRHFRLRIPNFWSYLTYTRLLDLHHKPI